MRHGTLQGSGFAALDTALLVAQAFAEGLAVPTVHKPAGQDSCPPLRLLGGTHGPFTSPVVDPHTSFLMQKTVGALPKWLFKQGVLN